MVEHPAGSVPASRHHRCAYLISLAGHMSSAESEERTYQVVVGARGEEFRVGIAADAELQSYMRMVDEPPEEDRATEFDTRLANPQPSLSRLRSRLVPTLSTRTR
jgi:hypothetical protein